MTIHKARVLVLGILFGLTVAAHAMAVPYPSWNFAAVENNPMQSADLEAEVKRIDKAYSVGPEFTGSRLFDKGKTRARLEVPETRWLGLRVAVQASSMTPEEFATRWESEKADAERYLRFSVETYGSDRGFLFFRGKESKITRVFLEDDRGRTYDAARLYSLEVPAPGSFVHNVAKFSLRDSEGNRIITPETRYVDLVVTAAGGQGRFRFKFDPVQLATEDAFNRWMTYYYGEPQPELVVKAIRYCASHGVFEKRSAIAPLVAFFGRIFSQHPDRLFAWVKELGDLKDSHKKVLWQALWFSGTREARTVLEGIAAGESPENAKYIEPFLKRRPPSVMNLALTPGKLESAGTLDMLWATFTVTGDEQYVLRIATILPWLKDDDAVSKAVGESARWSLTANAVQHQRVFLALAKRLPRETDEVKPFLIEILEKAAISRRRVSPLPVTLNVPEPADVRVLPAPAMNPDNASCSNPGDVGKCHDPF